MAKSNTYECVICGKMKSARQMAGTSCKACLSERAASSEYSKIRVEETTELVGYETAPSYTHARVTLQVVTEPRSTLEAAEAVARLMNEIVKRFPLEDMAKILGVSMKDGWTVGFGETYAEALGNEPCVVRVEQV